MFGWTKSKRESSKSGRKFRPARLGLLLFVLLCAAVVYWDGTYQEREANGGRLAAEAAPVDEAAAVAAGLASASANPGNAGEDRTDGSGGANGTNGTNGTDSADGADASEATDAGEQTTEAAALFAGYRLERESSRDEELALLQEIISDPSCTEAARSEAEQRRLAVARAMENEAAAESLLAAKGFGETVVMVSGEQATVICGLELTGAIAARMAEAVAGCCGISFENVIIVNR